MSRFQPDARPARVYTSESIADFYREEFLKHRQCLRAQRDCFSEPALASCDEALTRVMNRLDVLCRQQNCQDVIAELLKKFDLLTGLSGWSDPKTFH